MKFRNVVFLFIAAVILVAWFTRPSYDDFVKFQADKQAQISSPPVIEFTNSFLFSRVQVTYFEKRAVPVPLQGDQKAAIAVPRSKEKYLGLFGRFWSLD